jgi:IS605 OrfB family transposase
MDGELAHQVSKSIVLFLYQAGNKVIIGNNILDAKNSSKMSKKVNQGFVQIPFRLFIDKLKWFGISLVEVDESWTSKSSYVSDDILKI